MVNSSVNHECGVIYADRMVPADSYINSQNATDADVFIFPLSRNKIKSNKNQSYRLESSLIPAGYKTARQPSTKRKWLPTCYNAKYVYWNSALWHSLRKIVTKYAVTA